MPRNEPSRRNANNDSLRKHMYTQQTKKYEELTTGHPL